MGLIGLLTGWNQDKAAGNAVLASHLLSRVDRQQKENIAGLIANHIIESGHRGTAEDVLRVSNRECRVGLTRRWRLPIAYRAIPGTALGIDLALIVASAIGAEVLYHKVPSEFEGEFSHTMAAAMFVAVLFAAAMRVQKLYSPTRLIVVDDQARSVLSAWCGAFLILASGVFTWGVSHDVSRGDFLMFWALGAVALLAHRAFWRIALPRALESGALRGRTVGEPKLRRRDRDCLEIGGAGAEAVVSRLISDRG